MKNFLIFILLTITLSSCLDNRKAKNSLTEDGLKGKVSFIEESVYIAVYKFGEAQKGSLIWKETAKYDENGNRTETNYSDSRTSWEHKYVYKYDENGNQIESDKLYSSGGLERKYIYKYDEKGNQIERNEYNSDGSLERKYIYKYDEKGNRIERNDYNSEGSLAYKYIYKYDEKGNNLEINGFYPDGSLEFKNTFEYEFDKIGNWIKVITLTSDKSNTITERLIEYYP